MQASNRIIVNTLAQYVRTIINMLLSLYSARLVLDILGVDDYGIYALVAGVVSMLSFFTNSLVSSTQRFLSITQGRKDLGELKKVFSNSLLLHIILGFVVLIVLECLTPFLFNGFLNIPSGREDAAAIVYQQVILMVYISFVAAPYRALLVSRENIVYTSAIDVMDGVLKVILVLLLPSVSLDKLEAYGWIMFGITSFNLLAFAIYSHMKYEECIKPCIGLFSKTYIKGLAKYTGWVTYSTLSISLRNQGLAIVLNKALGTAINAAYGIGAQISGMVSFISTSFNNSIAPQLMSSEGGGERERMWRLAKAGSKIPFLLLAMIGIPTMFEMQTLLELWLIEVPENTMLFGCTFLAMQILDQLTTGLGMANRAIGNIGRYTLFTYTPKLFILPLGWYILYTGGSLLTVCIVFLIIETICMLLRIPLLRKEQGFSVWDFIRDVFLRSCPPIIVSLIACIGVNLLTDTSYRIIITYLVSIPIFILITYFGALNATEKAKVNSIIKPFKTKHNSL